MAIIDLVQRSEAWFEWRKGGITASMIPVIMDMSPYQTPYELWAELVGLKEPADLTNNIHVQRGVAQEPEARDAVEEQYGKPYLPVCVEADHETLFRASLDGLYKNGSDKEVLEIKCPSEKIYNEILEQKGKSASFQMYAAQVQWQLNCSGANQAKLYFYLRGKRPICITIKRNDAFIARAEECARSFYEHVQSKQPVDMIDGRDKVVYDTPLSSADTTWLDRVEQYKEKSLRLADIEKKAKAIKADLKQLESYFTDQIPKGRSTFDKDGIRATKVERQGGVDYEKVISAIEDHFNAVVPQNLIDDNRKEGTEYFRISVTNEETKKVEDVQIEHSEPKWVPSPLTVSHEQPGNSCVENVDYDTEKTKAAPVVTPEPEVKMPSAPIPQANFFEKSQTNMFF